MKIKNTAHLRQVQEQFSAQKLERFCQGFIRWFIEKNGALAAFINDEFIIRNMYEYAKYKKATISNKKSLTHPEKCFLHKFKEIAGLEKRLTKKDCLKMNIRANDYYDIIVNNKRHITADEFENIARHLVQHPTAITKAHEDYIAGQTAH